MGIASRRLLAAGLTVLVGAGVALVAPPQVGAGAGVTVQVTTTEDVTDPDDGFTSLREALDLVADGGVSTVELVADATYPIDDCLGGELRVSPQQPLLLEGHGAEVVQHCDGDSFFDGVGAHPVELRSLELRAAEGVETRGVALDLPLTVRDLVMSGALGDGAAGILAVEPLQVIDSTFQDLHSEGHAGAIAAFDSLELTRTEIVENDLSFGFFGYGGLRAEDLRVEDNGFGATAIVAGAHVVMERVVVSHNEVGAAVLLAQGGAVGEGDAFVVRDSGFVGNTQVGDLGEQCCPVLGFTDAEAEVSGTSVVGNEDFRWALATDQGEDEAPRELVVENSTIVGNGRDDEAGTVGVQSPGPVSLQHVTVGGNTDRSPGQVGTGAEVVAGELEATSSYVLGSDEPSCEVGSATSHGGNVSTDGTCGFDEADDREGVAWDGEAWSFEWVDIEADVPVVVPVGDDPGRDLRRGADCGDALPLDQLGTERPQGAGCDTGAVETEVSFSDVGPGHPFFEEIGWVASQGIAVGYADGSFRPGAVVTRQAMAAFLHRLAGAPEVEVPDPPTFSDVGVAHPFVAEVEWAAGEGIAEGFGDGTFRPGARVTRQATAAFLYRLAGEPEVEVPSPPTFSDVGAAHPFRVEVEWLASEGIAEGYVDGTFRPGFVVSRQAMAAFLHRYAT